jgi:hypothetical protein
VPVASKFEFVQPSSLIFVVLIAIWAAYFLQHWVRRREHLATARSVDRFSDAMHVLERRCLQPEVNLSESRPRSYAASPARPSRPEGAVKPPSSPIPEVPAAAVHSTRIFHLLAGMSARRLRGISFLASLFVTLLVSLLTAVSVLDWWTVPVVLAILIADVAWLRQAAGRSDAVFDSGYDVQPGAEAQPGHEAEPEPELETVFGAEAVFETASVFDRESVFDPEAVFDPESTQKVDVPEAGPVKVTLPFEVPVEVDPSCWEPVPVPPPTYTLKAIAEPVIRPNAVTDHEAGRPWSLDGMVYDCELEELVESRSATGA